MCCVWGDLGLVRYVGRKDEEVLYGEIKAGLVICLDDEGIKVRGCRGNLQASKGGIGTDLKKGSMLFTKMFNKRLGLIETGVFPLTVVLFLTCTFASLCNVAL